MIIWHLTEERLWHEARPAGEYAWSTRGHALADVGYVHASHIHQLEQVAIAFYADVEDGLVVLGIDTEVLARHGTPLVEEPAVPGGTELFPHLYGPIPLEAVVQVRQVSLTADGLVCGDEITGAAIR